MAAGTSLLHGVGQWAIWVEYPSVAGFLLQVSVEGLGICACGLSSSYSW
jgi:hypothetical protein